MALQERRMQQAPNLRWVMILLKQLEPVKLSGRERKMELNHLADLCQTKKQWKIKNDGISVRNWIGIIIFPFKNKCKIISIFFLYVLFCSFLKCLPSAGENIWRDLFVTKSLKVFNDSIVKKKCQHVFFLLFSECLTKKSRAAEKINWKYGNIGDFSRSILVTWTMFRTNYCTMKSTRLLWWLNEITSQSFKSLKRFQPFSFTG